MALEPLPYMANELAGSRHVPPAELRTTSSSYPAIHPATPAAVVNPACLPGPRCQGGLAQITEASRLLSSQLGDVGVGRPKILPGKPYE
jgi:hypothetical protein